LSLGVLGLGEGFGAGYSGAAFLLWDLMTLNTALDDAGYPTLEGSFVLYGGMGLGGNDLRFGAGGFGGSLAARAGEKYARLSLGFGGASWEIVVLESGDFSATVGSFFGGGGVELRLRSRNYSSFGDALAHPADLYLSRGFFLFLPYVSMELWPTNRIGIRVTAGNLVAFPGPWEAGEAALPGPPEGLRGPFFSVLLAFGGKGGAEEGQPSR